MLDTYLTALRRTPLDQQTEMTGRAALQALLEAAIAAFGPAGAVVVHEPRRVAEGAPDYKFVRASGILGYFENKSVGHDLDRLVRRDPQIAKYRKLISNLLVTDYLRFILVTPAETVEASLGPSSLLEGKLHPPRPERAAEVEALLRRFLSASPIGIGRARDLAEALAVRAQLLRDGLAAALVAQADSKRGGRLLGLYEAFRAQVSHDLTTSEFADAFAQTLVYGLSHSLPGGRRGLRGARGARRRADGGASAPRRAEARPRRLRRRGGRVGRGGALLARGPPHPHQPAQGFADVPREVWGFTIGGYQVLDKYLKSRRGRVLTLDEIETVEAVVNVLAFTLDRMAEIYAAYGTAFPG